MDTYTELLLEAIAQCDENSVKYCLQKGFFFSNYHPIYNSN